MASITGPRSGVPAVEFVGVGGPADDRMATGPAGRGRPSPPVVADVVLSIAPGEFVAIVGPACCGKSALLDIAAGLKRPSAGAVRIFGVPLDGLNRDAAYLMQGDTLLPWHSARGNLIAGLRFTGVPAAEARQRAEDWLATLGLADSAHCLPHRLDGGRRRRVMLAQVLAVDRRIVLLDEPFAQIDSLSRQSITRVLLERAAVPGPAVLMATQDLADAILLADRVVILSAGPASQPVGNFPIPLERPRDGVEMRTDRRFLQLQERIGAVLRDESIRELPEPSHARRSGIPA